MQCKGWDHCSLGSTPRSEWPLRREWHKHAVPEAFLVPAGVARTITCVSEPWQDLIQSKCLSWFPPGLGLNSSDKVLGHSTTSCVSPLRSLHFSEPSSHYAKWKVQGALVGVLPKDTHAAVLLECLERLEKAENDIQM